MGFMGSMPIAGVIWQPGDVADGARARPLGGAEGLADEVGNVGFAALAFGSRGLNEHWLRT